MREDTRLLLDKAIEATIGFCRKLARVMLVSSSEDVTVLGVAWSIAQSAALAMREELERTPEGRELVSDGQRSAAGKLPS